MTTSNNETNSGITKKDLRKVFWKSLPFEISWNYVRQDHMGFAYSMTPVIEKLYKTKENRKEALERHMEFFNITVYFSTLVLGIVTAMEERRAKDPNFDTSSINNVKASLMGPLSGIGDSIFLGTLRIIAAGIGASLCMNGNPFGAILFLLLYNIPAFAVRYIGMMKGYELGTTLLEKIQKSGMMDKVLLAAGILGIMVIGAMCKDMVYTEVALSIGSGDTAQSLQEILNGIMPGMIGLSVTWVYYWLLKKKSTHQY